MSWPFRRRRPASGSTASSPDYPRSAPEPRPSASSPSGRVLVDGRRRAEEPPALGGRGAHRSTVAGAARGRRSSPSMLDGVVVRHSRTSACSWSTSPPASSCTRRAGPAARDARPRPARGRGIAGGEEAEPPRSRPPARPGHVRACSSSRATPRPTGACRASSAAVSCTREYLALVRGRPRSRRGRIEAPIGRDRRDRDAHVARHRAPARRGDALRGASSSYRRTRCSAYGSRPAGRIRSVSTSRPIDLPVSGDPVYGRDGRRRPRSASSSTLPASRSRIPRPASRSTSRRRCRPTSRTRSSARARSALG